MTQRAHWFWATSLGLLVLGGVVVAGCSDSSRSYYPPPQPSDAGQGESAFSSVHTTNANSSGFT